MNRRSSLLVLIVLLFVFGIAAVTLGAADVWQPTPVAVIVAETEVPVLTAAVTATPTITLPATLTPAATATALPTATPALSVAVATSTTSMLSPLSTPSLAVSVSVSPLETPTLPVSPLPTPALPVSPLPTPTAFPVPAELHVPILMYHYVSVLPSNADSLRRGLTVVPEMFEAQLQYLTEQGYTTVTLQDLYDALSVGKPLPEKPIVLTFDDGYKDAYTDVLPLLQKYGFVGEFFILATPPHFESPDYMTWAEIAKMAKAGMSMQGHGRDHYDLRNRSYDFLVNQILGIKEAVEAHTEQSVTFFCYPAGKYDRSVLAVVESAGYLGGVTTEWGTTERLDNRFTWPRIRVHGAWSLEKFIDVLERLEQ